MCCRDLLDEGTANDRSQQSHQTGEPVFVLAHPQRALGTGFSQAFARGTPHAVSDDLTLEMDDAVGRDLVQVRRFPAGDGLGALHGLLPGPEHDPRFGADLPVRAVYRFVRYQASQPLRSVCGAFEELEDPLPGQRDLDRNGESHGVLRVPQPMAHDEGWKVMCSRPFRSFPGRTPRSAVLGSLRCSRAFPLLGPPDPTGRRPDE